MSSEEGLAAWLRREIGYELAAAREVIAACILGCARPCDFHPAAAAEWHEMSSGVLDICEGLDRADTWEGVWAMGDSRVTRFIAANDPQNTIARCEADLAILDEHGPDDTFGPDDVCCCACGDRPQVPFPCRTVRLLASGYRHRPGYREEWRP